MKKTTIQVSEEIALKLQKLKQSLTETYDDLIKKLINFYEKHKKD